MTHSVGAASIEITPNFPVRLSGYGVRTKEHSGVFQRLYSSALALDSKDGLAIVVTVDNCGVPAAIRNELLTRINKRIRIRGDCFTITSTHTHCAPMLTNVLPNLFSRDISPEHLAGIDRYTLELTDKIESVCLSAVFNIRPATLSWSIGTVDFAANRRNFPIKPSDHSLPILKAVGNDGQLIAIFTVYACHCTTLDIDQIHG